MEPLFTICFLIVLYGTWRGSAYASNYGMLGNIVHISIGAVSYIPVKLIFNWWYGSYMHGTLHNGTWDLVYFIQNKIIDNTGTVIACFGIAYVFFLLIRGIRRVYVVRKNLTRLDIKKYKPTQKHALDVLRSEGVKIDAYETWTGDIYVKGLDLGIIGNRQIQLRKEYEGRTK